MELPIEIFVSVAGGEPKPLGEGSYEVADEAGEFRFSGAGLREAIAVVLDDAAKHLREVTDEDIEAAK